MRSRFVCLVCVNCCTFSALLQCPIDQFALALPSQVDLRKTNSWTMKLHEVSTAEMAEVSWVCRFFLCVCWSSFDFFSHITGLCDQRHRTGRHQRASQADDGAAARRAQVHRERE